MLYDLGLEEKDFDDDQAVMEKIQHVERSFDLVMISEYFSESLVLLKKILCWNMSDVTSFKLNSRMNNRKYQLSETNRNKLENYLKADYKLYNHFKKIFIRKMEKFGFNKLEQEVSGLNNLNKQIADQCDLSAQPNAYLKGDQKWYGPPYLIGFTYNNTNNTDCPLMTMSGLKFIKRLRIRQRKKAENILRNLW